MGRLLVHLVAIHISHLTGGHTYTEERIGLNEQQQVSHSGQYDIEVSKANRKTKFPEEGMNVSKIGARQNI